jgi:HSP20 family protein
MLHFVRTSFPTTPHARTAFNRADTQFDRFFGHDGETLRPIWGGDEIPVSAWQDDTTIHVDAEIPGVTESDVEIMVHKGVLTIKAERRPAEGRTYLYNGRAFGRLERAIILPEFVDSGNVEAALTDGVLHLTLPKHPAAQPKKIALKTS